jgi:hypothetical protein
MNTKASHYVIELLIVLGLTYIILSIATDWEAANVLREQEKARARGYGFDDVDDATLGYYALGIFGGFIYYLIWYLRIVYYTKSNSTEVVRNQNMDKLLYIATIPFILIAIAILLLIF